MPSYSPYPTFVSNASLSNSTILPTLVVNASSLSPSSNYSIPSSSPSPTVLSNASSISPAPSINNASSTEVPSNNQTSSSIYPSYSAVPTINSTLSALPTINMTILFDPILQYNNSLKIEGAQSLSQFGFAADCSEDGSLLAVGAKDALNEAGDATGAVYLYSLDDFSNGIVTSVEIDGESETKPEQPEPFMILYGKVGGSEFGNAVALSRDGKRMVVGSRAENEETGAMRIYDINDNIVTMRSEIVGITAAGRAGWSVAVSICWKFYVQWLSLLSPFADDEQLTDIGGRQRCRHGHNKRRF